MIFLMILDENEMILQRVASRSDAFDSASVAQSINTIVFLCHF